MSDVGVCFGLVLNTGWITRDVFVIAEQGYTDKAFSAFHTTTLVGGLRVFVRLGGDTAGTGEPSRAIGYFRPYEVILCK